MNIVAPDIFERATIGAMLTLPAEKRKHLALSVRPEHFHTPRNEHLYSVLRDACANGTPYSPDTAVAAIKLSGCVLEHFGAHEGAVEAVVEDCIQAAEPLESSGQYANQLKLIHARKEMMRAIDQAAIEATSGLSPENVAVIPLGKVAEAASIIRQDCSNRGGSIAHIAPDFLKRYSSGDHALPFPQYQLNTIGGARPGNIIVGSGYTGAKKSWWGIDLMSFWMKLGKRVQYRTIEMSRYDVIERLIAMEHEYKHEDVVERRIPSSELSDCFRILEHWPIEIIDGACSIDAVISDTLSAGDSKPDVIIIDHLHLMEIAGGDYRMGLNLMLSRLKTFAVEQEIIIVLLAQVARPDKRTGDLPDPTIYMFKESGAIEQIADYAIFVHNKTDSSGRGYTIMYCEKQRSGQPAGKFEVGFNKYRLR